MNIEKLEKIKVYDRYDGDLLSLLYDKESNLYFIEIAYNLWDQYFYFEISKINAILFTHGKKTLGESITNSKGLLIGDNFTKHFPEINKENKDKYQDEDFNIYDWIFDHYHQEYNLEESIAVYLLQYQLNKNNTNDKKYTARDGSFHGILNLEIDELFQYVQILAKSRTFEIQINQNSYILKLQYLEPITCNNLKTGLLILLEKYFYGISITEEQSHEH